jgi:hypothetical protein
VLTCKQISDLATEYAEGALDVEATRRFEEHVAGCPACEAWVRQLQVVARAAGALPAPELPDALAAELMRRFDDWQARGARAALAPVGATSPTRPRPSLLAALAVAVAGSVLVALARNPSHAPQDWALGIGLAGTALALAAWLRSFTPGFALAAGAMALLAALVRGREGALDVASGLECLMTEALLAAGGAGAAWLVLRRGAAGVPRPALAAWAVAGALVGDAALQVTCTQHASLPHLLAFHAGGVLAVVVLGWLRARPSPEAA